MQWLDTQVLPLINKLDADDSIELAKAYSAPFQSLGLETEHPAVAAARWKEVVHMHARLVRL